MSERVVSGVQQEGDSQVDYTLRPKSLKDYIGQYKIVENLKISIAAAKQRSEPLDHTLLYGPPGLGKTTLSTILANEMESPIKITSGPAIERAGDMVSILTRLRKGEILFIDEIHRLNPAVEEILYPAMEDGELDLMIGEGPAARSVRIELQPFTVVGATTRLGLLTTPLRERFGINMRLEYYSSDELIKIVRRNADLLEVSITNERAAEIANRARGTPRVAEHLLHRVRGFVIVESH